MVVVRVDAGVDDGWRRKESWEVGESVNLYSFPVAQ